MDLVYKNEQPLFRLMLAVSLLAWTALLIGTRGAALAYVALFYMSYRCAQSALVSRLRGTGVRITPQQFPDLYRRIAICCERLALDPVPEAYLLHLGGSCSPFATRFLGKPFIVLYSHVVDALESHPDALNFYIGHEIGHIKRQHRRWAALLAPAALTPLLGAAYARAREYTCDRHGVHACDELGSAQAGLAVLAAGGQRWRHLNAADYAEQARQAGGFWMSFHELIGDQPWLIKRMAVMRSLAQGGALPAPSRHALAYPLALCVPRLGLGLGGIGPVLTLLALATVLSMLVLPAWHDYQTRARMTQVVAVGREATAAVERYYYANGQTPTTLEQTGYAMDDPNHVVLHVAVDAGNGVVRVAPSDLRYRGRAIAFTPRVDENRRVIWRCTGDDIPASVLPPDCRDQEPTAPY